MGKTLKDVKLDPRNANRHSPFGTGLLENSLRENGAGRSILLSNDNVVIAGNGLAEAGAAIGVEDIQIVESDGKKIIAVKRTDIESGTAEFYRMALADNVVPQKNIVFDTEIVEAIVEEFPEVKVWAGIITEPPGNAVDKDRANLVHMGFDVSAAQSGKIKQAIKLSKEINAAKVQKADNANANGNALYFICMDYIKANK